MRALRLALLVMIAALPLPAAVAWAHGDALPFIAFWNRQSMPFAPPVAACQRMLGHARQRCMAVTLRVEERCRRKRLTGASCDAAVDEARIAAAKLATTAAIERECSEDEARALYFANRAEAVTDKDFVCTRVPRALLDATYAPAIGASWQLNANDAHCVRLTSSVAAKFVRIVSNRETDTLDRLALESLPPSSVNHAINRTEARLGALRTRIVALALRHCPQLETVYRRSALDLILQAELQADCAVGAGYIQSAFACPRGYLPR